MAIPFASWFHHHLQSFLSLFLGSSYNDCVMVKDSNQSIMQMINISSLVTFVCSVLSGEEEQHPTSFLVRPAVVEGILLYNRCQQPLLWQDGGKPCVCPDPLGSKPRGIGQVGRGTDRVPLDRRHYDPAETGRLDPPFGEACCGMFPDQGRPLDQLGRRHEGKNREKGSIKHVHKLN